MIETIGSSGCAGFHRCPAARLTTQLLVDFTVLLGDSLLYESRVEPVVQEAGAAYRGWVVHRQDKPIEDRADTVVLLVQVAES